MSKKIQSSTRLEMLVGVDKDSKENSAQKNKAAKKVEKPNAAEKPKVTGNTKESTTTKEPKAAKEPKVAKQLKTAQEPKATKEPKTAKKPNAANESKTSSSKKSKTSTKAAKPIQPEKGAAGNDESLDQRKAVKTPQVLKLVEHSSEVNPVLLAGKSRVPSQLRGKQSLTKLMRREMGEEFSDVDDTVVVNITELAIEHEAPEILDRFNACSCDKCVEVFSRKIAERVPVRFARVNKDGRGTGNRELSERVAPMRKMVITEMIKELIGSKKRCFHDDTE
ncbi:MAG: hypothetical protein ACI4JS_00435 [Oscillospiraceae bacterium]